MPTVAATVLGGLGYMLEIAVGLLSFGESWYSSRVAVIALSSPPSAAATELSRHTLLLGISFYESLMRTDWWQILVVVWAIQGVALVLWRVAAARPGTSKMARTAGLGALGCCLFVTTVIAVRVFHPPHNGTLLEVDRALGYRTVLDVRTGAAGFASLSCLIAAFALTAIGFGLYFHRARVRAREDNLSGPLTV